MNTAAEIFKALSHVRDGAINAVTGFLSEKLKGDSVNIEYYRAEDCVDSYYFLDFGRDGYGRGIMIDSIERKPNGDYIFNMVTEDGDDWNERELSDFNAVELAWILEILEQTFDVIEEEYNGVILPKGQYGYDEE